MAINYCWIIMNFRSGNWEWSIWYWYSCTSHKRLSEYWWLLSCIVNNKNAASVGWISGFYLLVVSGIQRSKSWYSTRWACYVSSITCQKILGINATAEGRIWKTKVSINAQAKQSYYYYYSLFSIECFGFGFKEDVTLLAEHKRHLCRQNTHFCL